MGGSLDLAAIVFIAAAGTFDLATGRIPDAFTLPAFAASMVARVLLVGFPSSCAALASSLASVSACSWILRSSFGGGDVKSALILGQLAGWDAVAAVVLASSACCAVAWGARRSLRIRYVPLMALWTAVCLMVQ